MRLVCCSMFLLLAAMRYGIADDSTAPRYPDHSRLLVYLDADGREHPVTTPADWAIRRGHILKGMEAAMGPLPDRSKLPPLDMRVTERLREEGYQRLTISIVTEPGDRVAAYLYLPDGCKPGRRVAAVLALQPTSQLGKGSVAGYNPRPNRAYALELAQRGYVVIAPDYPSFGDSKNYDFNADNYVSGTMKGIVNHMRCVDLLESLEEVEPERIGVIGHSLGGHNAIFVGVFDRRLKVIVSSSGWTPFHDDDMPSWTGPRYMPLLRTKYHCDPDRVPFDFYELVAALAPRAFFSNSPQHDSDFAVAGVKKAVPKVRAVYTLFGGADQFEVRYPDSKHDFPPAVRREAYNFIDRVLNHKPVRRVP